MAEQEYPDTIKYQCVYKPLVRPQVTKKCNHHIKNPFFRSTTTVIRNDSFFLNKKLVSDQIKSHDTMQDIPDDINEDQVFYQKSHTLDYTWRPNNLDIIKQLKILASIKKYKKKYSEPLLHVPRSMCKSKTLVLDLDETLIHSSQTALDGYQSVTCGSKKCMYLSLRPFLYSMLQLVRPFYEIAIFTTSEKAYADAILNYIDPYKIYFDYRLYRCNCTTVDNFYIKDLRILGRNLKDIAIVDNTLISFAYQITNGIPIDSYNGCSDDKELEKLSNYLLILKDKDDIRDENYKTFGLASDDSYKYQS